MIKPADYVQTKDRSIHIVNCLVGKLIIGTEIYRLVKNRENHCHITPIKYMPRTNEYYEKYVLRDKDNQRIIHKGDIIKFFSAKEAYKKNKSKLFGIWKNFDNFFHGLGIDDIGIYGSVMLEFDTHTDVDFVIYGSKNRDVVFRNIHLLHREYDKIYKSTIESRTKIARQFYNNKNSFEKIFYRQWSTVEVGNGVHSTLHFVKKRLSKFNPLKKNLVNKYLTGFVGQSKNFDFWPKTATLKTKNKTYTIFSTFWPYQSAFHENERVEILGAVDEDNNVIYVIDRKIHYIKI